MGEIGLSQVEETGKTFEENARLKALTLARATSTWALADDSGLEVDAFGGAPGVYSARYAGQGADDDANNRKLLDAMRNVPEGKRWAQFRCVLALASPDGRVWTAEGSCRGRIAPAPQGRGGFGYDPLFIPEGKEETFAQMTKEAKQALSHRGIALTKMVDVLRSLRCAGIP